MLKIRHLSKRFGDGNKPVIDDLNLSLDTGQSVSIRGASGSGKSTLLSLIAGFDEPDSGSITVHNVTLPFKGEKQADRFRREHLGVVFQSFNLLGCLSVEDNIAFTARLKGNADPDYQQHIMQRLGISALAGKSAALLSGGEQQRVAIARALVHKPSLILADEPTGNLDEDNSEKVSSALYALCRELNTTLVVVTHSNEVAALAQRQCWLRHGKLED
ncbi:ABC transporter ATP-binding protein [Alteromonas sp. 1_MG-2023]|uniref:ABC transporter ATP-binding protein n=1 Tax=Alteromonas sp. 1_MG-2023 TaxID=3062669 RepID=UPI0026E3A236|nr:ABC transporter ATP-binding protein [Alteromonas sp. 1_MG-2023]MDO6476149.1 ABC transporter ATP-binding protein [Alteromonas sp. 1_MG-2023]